MYLGALRNIWGRLQFYKYGGEYRVSHIREATPFCEHMCNIFLDFIISSKSTASVVSEMV